jgi:hypothetical protein
VNLPIQPDSRLHTSAVDTHIDRVDVHAHTLELAGHTKLGFIAHPGNCLGTRRWSDRPAGTDRRGRYDVAVVPVIPPALS